MDIQSTITEQRLQRDLRYICIMGLEGRRLATAEPVEAEVLTSRGFIDDKGITPQGRDFMLSHERHA